MGGIIIIASSVFLFFIVAGFFLGFARDWCRSLIRFVIVVADFILSLLISPLITNAVINKFASGTKFSFFSYTIDFSEIAEGMFESNLGDDLNTITEEIEPAARALINVAVNIVLFLVLFLLILILSLIIYWVVLIIVKNVNKKEKEKEKQENHISTRFIGGFEGVLTMLIIGFVFLIPLFGAMNICNNFLKENSTKSSEPVASAICTQNIMAGQLYYTEDKQIGKFENYIEKYASVKETYDKSFIGKIFNFTRLGKVGSVFFDHLTRVKYKDEKVKFSDEMTVMIDSYNLYKETFKDNEFDATKNESLDNVVLLVDKVSKSKVATNIIEKIMPKVLDNWSNGEKFLGVEIKASEEVQDMLQDVFEIAKTIKTINRLGYNVKNIVEVVKILNDHGVVASVKDKTLIDKLQTDDTVVKEVILKLSETEEFSNNLPVLLDDLVEVLYKKLTNENKYENLSKETTFEIENWEVEAEKVQQITNKLIDLYKNINNETQGQDNLVSLLNGMGGVIDKSKESQILSSSIKNFINSYIESEKFANNILDENSKNTLTNYITEKWNVDDESFKFEKLFNIVSKIVDFADKFAKSADVKLNDVKETLEEVVKDESLKSYVVEFIEINILDEVVKNDNFKKVALDLFKEVVYNSNVESLDDDINAGQALIDLANQAKQFDEEVATMNLETVAKSNVFMNYIDTTSTVDGSSNLQKVINSTLTVEEKTVFVMVVDKSENLTLEEKTIFNKLFLSISL